jgi:nucleotide-binding universal stress UspA family protein
MTSSKRDRIRWPVETQKHGDTRGERSPASRVPSAEPAHAREQERAAIVCGVDHSEGSRRALHVAADLAERLDSRLVLVNVRSSAGHVPPGLAAEARLARERAVEGGRRLLADVGGELLDEPRGRRLLGCVQARVEFGESAARLAAVADEIHASLIVVGARGRGAMGAALLGSVSQGLASNPSRPVLVVPPKATPDRASNARGRPAASIVCGVDGSPAATSAARVAGRFASALALRLVLVHVEQGGKEGSSGAIDFDALLDAATRPRLRLLHRAANLAGDAQVEACLAEGTPAEALEEVAARESAQLIAVGTRGRGALKALALGSVSRTLAASASLPVLIVNDRSTRSPASDGGE